MSKKLIIIGAGGHGKVVCDIAQKLNVYKSIAFLDDANIKEIMGVSVVGKVSDAEKFINKADIFVAIGNNKVRKDFIEKLISMGASIPVLVHPNAVIGSHVEIGVGSVVMAGAVINPCVQIGKGVIVNTCASIDHDSVVGDFCHISIGSRVAGTVNIGENCFLGAGAVTKNNVSICADCVVGAGAVVVKNIEEKGTYVGVPAKLKV